MIDNQENNQEKRIFLIENQFYHFRKIWERLNETGYKVCPYSGESNGIDKIFKEVINLVRVYLNPRYGSTKSGGNGGKKRRELALAQLLRIINRCNPHIFVIDYILVGNYFGETGLNLALKLREEGYKQPIVFLSNSERKKAIIIANYAKLQGPKHWIYKGFAGKKVLEEKSFEKHILPTIENILASKDMKTASDKINELKERFLKLKKIYVDSSGTEGTKEKDEREKLVSLINKLDANEELYHLYFEDLEELVDTVEKEILPSDNFNRKCDELLNKI